MESSFDYIIVGGGTAGCVLANRLSESGKNSVLLIEAGGEARSPWINIPAGFYKLLTNKKYNWQFETTPEDSTFNRTIALPRGKGLGGSTLINGMIYVRGQPLDYDHWAQKGCTGWGWDEVLPVFKAIEDWNGVNDDDLRGSGGPFPVSEVVEHPPISKAFVDAGVDYGLPFNPDYNGKSQLGVGYYQVNQKNGERFSAERAYLSPVRNRKNLTVKTGFHVSNLVFSEGRAIGVVGERRGKKVEWRSHREIILACGAFQTPQLLELSGIGDPKVLKRHGIKVQHALPQVGENYIDHFCTRMSWEVSKPVTLNEQTRGLKLVSEVLRFAVKRKGILTFGTGLGSAFLKTRKELETPDAQLFFMHASYENAAERILDKHPGMTVGVSQMRPHSVGHVHIQSNDPSVQPDISPNFLSAEEDRRCLIEAMKVCREIINRAPMDKYRNVETTPGLDCNSDDDWLQFARETGQTIYHPVGTCRMGSDPEAVVEPDLRVKGVRGLRIADASIMPTIVSGNTQAAVLMIAEKASQIILNQKI